MIKGGKCDRGRPQTWVTEESLYQISPGSDNVPYWVYRDCAHELSEVFTMIVNMSVASGVVPSVWRTAIITPVPKSTPVNEVSDFRPISVTPILSRIVERLIVREHLFPTIPTNEFLDQYGFKPSGSTTAAFLDLTYKISNMLEDNKYVRCLLIDFHRRLILLTISLWSVN